jgi:hypothetical protein
VFPDVNLLLSELWSGGDEFIYTRFVSQASNIVLGTNPPYSVVDFSSIYPKFIGPATVLTGTFTNGSSTVSVTSTAGVAIGQMVIGSAIAPGSTITGFTANTSIVLSQPAIADGIGLSFNDYQAPLLPLAVINCYIALASSHLVQARWLDDWQMGMALFIAHFATLWLLSEGNQCSTPGKAAAAGLAQGIATSESAGPVSIGMQPTTGLDNWASWTETQYGKIFATMARTQGAGMLWIY